MHQATTDVMNASTRDSRSETATIPTSTRSRFYAFMGLLGVAVAAAGFFGTYARPMYDGSFSAPALVHWHGALAFGWVALFALQPWLIRYGAYRTHRALGVCGAIAAVALAMTMVVVQHLASTRDAAAGGGDMARAMVLGTVSTAVQFVLLVGSAVYFVRRAAIHKRLMLLATIVVLWPAWFRWRHFLPWVPQPDLWLGVVAADSLIVIAWLRDRILLGHINPVLRNVGVLLMLEHFVEVSLIGHPRWVEAGVWLYRFLTPYMHLFTTR